MIDHFALLQQPRQPWLEAEPLKQKFLEFSAAHHPDRVAAASPEARAAATQQFTALNAAYNCLKEPRDRVRHLVELELGRKPGDLRNVPPRLAEAFMRIAAVVRSSEQLIAEKGRLHSPLLLAGFFERVQPHLVVLEQLQSDVAVLEQEALGQLRELDAQWQQIARRSEVLDQLEQLAQVLGFHARWRSQLQEAHVRLTL